MNSRHLRHVVAILTLYIVLWGALVSGKPIHIDEANFLSLTTGDWLEPHNIKINWQGRTEVAFDVLSNPPGIAWWLWPVRNFPSWVMRIWMLPWAFLALWGALQIGRSYGKKHWPAVVMLSCPIFVLSIGGLMPDMPLLGCLLAGWGGYLRTNKTTFLIMMGMACLFRYNAVFFCFMFLIFDLNKSLFNRDFIIKTVFMFLPLLTLFTFDVLAYGAVHFWHMIAFQTEHISLFDRISQGPALLSMLVGGAAAPVLVKVSSQKTSHWCIGILIGSIVIVVDSWGFFAGLWNFAWVVVGVTVSLGMLQFSTKQSLRWSLFLIGGFLFLMGLRFSATRYWMPFFFIFIMVFVFQTSLSKIKIGTIWSFVLSSFLFYDDYELAESQYLAAKWVGQKPITGAISGHWGFQYYTEQLGWVSVEDDQPLPEQIDYWLTSSIAWPQEPILDCFRQIESFEIPVLSGYLPHVHRLSSRSNFHASAVYGQPPVRSYAPWGFGDEPYERVVLYQRCDER